MASICCTTSRSRLLKVLNHTKMMCRWKKTKSKLTYGKQKSDPTHLALKHFDQNYRPIFGDQWPVIRLALLSMQSYGALVNNYSDVDLTVDNLRKSGVEDFVQPCAEKMRKIYSAREEQDELGTDRSMMTNLEDVRNENERVERSSDDHSSNLDDVTRAQALQKREIIKQSRELEEMESHDGWDNDGHTGEKDGRVLKPWWAEKYIVAPGYEHRMDLLLHDQDQHEIVGAPEIDIDTVTAKIDISPHLRCFIHNEVAKRLPPAKKGVSQPFLQYYIMDAASILPVVALGIEPDDTVLDLCAGPGGKSLAILQTALIGSLTANEKVSSRRRRLQEVLGLYIPKEARKSGAVQVTGMDGCDWGQIEPACYDRVLVDVPCTTDRVSAKELDNNIFKISRSRERWDLPQLQSDLLGAGLQAVKPGGTVVYSTCTMSPLQNDGVVQSAIMKCQMELNLDAAVVDLSPLAESFGDVFSFHPKCNYGQLVVPRLARNFGPMYFARLQRTS